VLLVAGVGGCGEGDCEDGVDEGCIFHFDGGGVVEVVDEQSGADDDDAVSGFLDCDAKRGGCYT